MAQVSTDVKEEPEWELEEDEQMEKNTSMQPQAGGKKRNRLIQKTKDLATIPSMSKIEAFTESFLGVDQGPEIPELLRAETREKITSDSEPLILSALNPYSKRIAVVPVRIVFILSVYALALLVTFQEEFVNMSVLAIGIAAVISPIIVRLCLFISERKVFRNVHDRKKKGQYPMVDWLSFTLFMDAVYNTLRAVKASGDPRESDAIRDFAAVYDERSEAVFADDGRFYFDFVADTGDGFDPTFTVANLMGRRSLTVQTIERGKSKHVTLPRARVVCHGGDICYPFSTYENFFYRFIQPYAWAFPKNASTGEKMYLAAGNHEYLDGLTGFRNIILPRKRIGGWLTPQRSSYFAIQLPRGWTMFVLDIGAEPEDIDDYQRDWFNRVVDKMDEDERIILVYHVPDWIKCGSLGFTNMAKLRQWRQDLGDRVRVVLAGDLHYYRRMEEVTTVTEEDGITATLSNISIETSPHATNCFNTSKVQYMVVGNGGAFNHATHYPSVDQCKLVGEEKTLHVANEFPSANLSKRTWEERWPYMFITTTNHIYARVLGGVYMVMFMAISPADYGLRRSPFGDFLQSAITSAFFYLGIGWLLVVHHILVTANFEINTFKKFFISINLIVWHTFAHVLFASMFRIVYDQFFLNVFDDSSTNSNSEFSWQRKMWFSFVGNIWMYVIGSFVSPMITVIYFWLSLNYFDWHYNEAISVIQIEDFKGFLRLGIKENGDLEMYSIVTDRTPHNWNAVPPNERSDDFPATLHTEELRYRLLEKVTLSKRPKENSI